jgi:hypothetical protein
MRLCGAMFELEQIYEPIAGIRCRDDDARFPFAERMATIAIDGVHIELRSLLI